MPRTWTEWEAVDAAFEMIEDGADIIDVGGESTRPGAVAVPADEELRRVIPVIEDIVSGRAARAVPIPISIDTYKAEVARAAIEAGASIVNDVSGLQLRAGAGQGRGRTRRRARPDAHARAVVRDV